MATTIGTTNIGLSELETAPGGSVSAGSNISFQTSGRRGWNLGNQGSGSSPFYTWGYGDGGAGGYLDPIYGLTPPTSGSNPPLKLSDWSGLQYWFDDVTLKYQNSQTPTFPPRFDAVSIEIAIADSSGNYSISTPSPNTPPPYIANFQASPGQSQPSQTIPTFGQNQFVMAKNLYWYISVDAQVDFTGGTLVFDINGTTVLNDTLPGGPFSGTLYDWQTSPSSGAGLTNSTTLSLEFTIS